MNDNDPACSYSDACTALRAPATVNDSTGESRYDIYVLHLVNASANHSDLEQTHRQQLRDDGLFPVLRVADLDQGNQLHGRRAAGTLLVMLILGGLTRCLPTMASASS